MGLNVDLSALVKAASGLTDAARDTGLALPSGWVVPAGADPISGAKVPQLNAQTAAVVNGMIDVLNAVAMDAYKIGKSAQAYSTQDDAGARTIGGRGGEIIANPIAEPVPMPHRKPPVYSAPSSTAIDPLTFAKQLQAGPGPGPAKEFAEKVRGFARDISPIANQAVADSAAAMAQWTPVGEKVADNLTRYGGWIGHLVTGMGLLADSIDSYSEAFRIAKSTHPTPEEIIAARKELLAAMRSKDEARTALALAKFEEQNARSAETVTGYSAATNTPLPGEDAAESAAGQAASQAAGGQSAGGGEQGSGEQAMDPSMLANLLPAMMNAMSSMGGLPLDQSSEEYLDDYALGDELYDDSYGFGSPGGYGGFGGGGGGGGGFGGSVGGFDAAAVAAPTPLTTSASVPAGLTQGLPRAPVIEPLSTSSPGGSSSGMRGAGMPMMPYMPMAPGAGGAGGGGEDRNRVVAWHPDRLMYVDDTPHTEMVIGERPTIAPSVTPPTPNSAGGNQHSSHSGGSA
ncbi:PPE domain-containing protein [Nocardia cyriacigeorgica]|uniref:PPE domain-containing protein n=1 Tax=Nocardia cyriacigeorgica TaxID=135487 RepID=A0A5R8NEC9_9NOCA|nr:PPE domain-containing protein [Nocardia cyriacigeorgica]TLF74019.1 PPE domain-containing protein [Nocardia cyriacigeorgica]